MTKRLVQNGLGRIERELGRPCPHGHASDPDNENAGYCRRCANSASSRRSRHRKNGTPRATPVPRHRLDLTTPTPMPVAGKRGRGRPRLFTLVEAERVLGRLCPHDRTYERNAETYCRRCANNAARVMRIHRHLARFDS